MNNLVTPRKVAQFCTDIIKHYCIFPKSVTISPDDRVPERYILQGGYPDFGEGTNNKKIPVLLLTTGHWIHLSITFERKNISQGQSHIIKGICLQVFNQDLDHNKMIFCAEWDNNDENRREHPQPHWHFHPCTEYLYEDERINVKTFHEYLDLVQSKQGFQEELGYSYKNKNNISKIHFAMVSQWHLNPDNDAIIPITEEYIYNWLKGCLKCISHQLIYAYS
jgi:hypothetical protein